MIIEDKLLLKPDDFKPSFKNLIIEGVLNPAAIRDRSGKIVLYIRVSERFLSKNKLEYPVIISGKKFRLRKERINKKDFVGKVGNVFLLKNNLRRISNISHFRKVTLDKSGMKVKKIDESPSFFSTEEYEECGIEDPRIVKIKGKYYMTYVSVSRKNGITSSIAVSKDLKKWKKLGVIFCHENKDVILFPEKINSEFVALHRPVGCFNFSKPGIWISYSKDLIYWGKERSLINPRNNSWDCDRIGSGTPPMKTLKGWLQIYHGVKDRNYCVGSILLDLKNPEKVIARTPKNKPLLRPENDYEKKGFVNNVVFPTGIIKDINKKSVLIYSGASDKYVTVKKMLIKDILDSMEYY